MLKDLFDKGKCALGYHVEAWQYAGPSVCRQTSRCSRCGVISERTAHLWNGWHRFDAVSCSATRECQRCGQQESRDDHAWDAWAYDQRDACGQHVRCSRCQHPGADTRVLHDRHDWEQSAFYGTLVSVCRRCGEMVFTNADGDEEPVTFQQADAAILHLMGSPTADELRQRIVQRQAVLFSPVVAHALRFAADQRASDDSDRQTIETLAGVIARCRDEGVDVVFPRQTPPAVAAPAALTPPTGPATPAPAVSPPRVDARLVGHWRSTEAMGSGGFSMATDTHLVLEADGGFAFWSVSRGSAGGYDSDREFGRWTSDASSLSIVFDSGSSLARRIMVEHDSMIWPDDGRYRLWERLR